MLNEKISINTWSLASWPARSFYILRKRRWNWNGMVAVRCWCRNSCWPAPRWPWVCSAYWPDRLLEILRLSDSFESNVFSPAHTRSCSRIIGLISRPSSWNWGTFLWLRRRIPWAVRNICRWTIAFARDSLFISVNRRIQYKCNFLISKKHLLSFTLFIVRFFCICNTIFTGLILEAKTKNYIFLFFIFIITVTFLYSLRIEFSVLFSSSVYYKDNRGL